MAVKILRGRIGSGKTTEAIKDFVNVVSENKGAFNDKACYFVVPEQFCVDVEGKILDKTDGLVTSEVISFNRLVYRILGEIYPDIAKPISSSGKAMLLTKIAYKNNADLIYFKDIYEKPSQIEKLLESLTELQKYNFTSDMLKALSEKVDGENSKAKINELAFFLDKYNELFSEKIVDIQLYYEKIAELIEEGKTSVSNSSVWIDSFSGFTKNELIVLLAIAKSSLNLTICLGYDESLKFVMGTANETYHDIIKLFDRNGIKYEIKDLGKNYSRFKPGSSLGYFAENYNRFIVDKEEKRNVDDSVSVYSCNNFYDEVRNAALKINELKNSGYRNSDIAVVVPDIEENSYVIESVFNAYGINYFLDKKSKISGHPAIRMINSFLKIVSGDAYASEIINLLKTGLYKPYKYKMEDIDLLENLMLKYGVKNQKGYKRMLDFLKDSDYKLKESAEDVYEMFYGVNGYVKEVQKCRNVDDVIKMILKFSEDISLYNALSQMAKDNNEAFSLIWNAFAGVVNECSEYLGDNKISGYRKLVNFVQKLFANGVSSLKLGSIPMNPDAVQIGNIARSRYSNKKVILILGANEGNFPPETKDKGYLGDKERTILKEDSIAIGYNSLGRAMLGEYNAYYAVFSASEKVILSYSLVDDSGSELLKATVISKIQNLFNLKVLKFTAERHESDAEDTNFDIDAELARKLLSIEETFNTSISRIEDFASCPYAYLLSNVLSIKERDELSVTNADTGNLFHALLEKAVGATDEKDFSELSDEDWKKRVADAVEKYYVEHPDGEYKFESTHKNKLLLDRIIGFANYEGKIFSEKSAKTGFKPIFEELVFGRNSKNDPISVDCDGFSTLLSGKIDRVDMRTTDDGKVEVALVDYKSGTKKISDAEINNGVLLQLLAYKTAVDKGLSNELAEKIGESAFVCSLSYYMFGKTIVSNDPSSSTAKKHTFEEIVDENISEKPSFKDKAGVYNFDELEKDNNDKIISIANEIAAGKFSGVYDEKSDSCRYCKYFNICTSPDRKDRNEN